MKNAKWVWVIPDGSQKYYYRAYVVPFDRIPAVPGRLKMPDDWNDRDARHAYAQQTLALRITMLERLDDAGEVMQSLPMPESFYRLTREAQQSIRKAIEFSQCNKKPDGFRSPGRPVAA